MPMKAGIPPAWEWQVKNLFSRGKMKPLVYYCRWHEASLRLRGRDDTAVWGHLVYKANTDEERIQEFRFALKTWQLTLQTSDGAEIFQLDEMGVVQSRLSAPPA